MRISDWSSDLCSSDLHSMIWRDAFDLPKRFREASPPLVTQVAIALAATLIAAGARGLLNLVVPGVVPYALIFPAVVGATLLGGTLAGGLTLAACQLLALYVVVPPTQSFAILNPDRKSTRLNSSHSCAARMPSSA